MWRIIILSTWLLLLVSSSVRSQVLTYQFVDPCTKQVTFFSVPATGTTVFFLGQSRQFTSLDVSSGAFATWINQVYSDYRKITPCSQQSGQVTQNQIISQAISGTVQSVVGSIMSQAQSASSTGSISGSDAASKGNNTSSENKNKDKNGNNSNRNNSSASSNNQTPVRTDGGSGNNTNIAVGNNSSGSNSSSNTDSKTGTSGSEKTEEVAASTTMSNDSRQEKQSDSKGKSTKTSGARSNPIIVQSDLTTAQNLDKSFTPILNLGLSRSSMTGASSWGLTSMTWLNFKQFAVSGRYTKIHFSKNGALKYIHNINLTGVYTYGNVLAFLGYSGILNAGKWGITGFNLSAACTLVTEEDNTYLSPSFTAFYTKPFSPSKRLTVSPEIYVISTPLIYSSKDQITTTDRTFSGFLGSGFDYQITKRFKFNINYKANLSTNPEFPILSFLLIGSKINL